MRLIPRTRKRLTPCRAALLLVTLWRAPNASAQSPIPVANFSFETLPSGGLPINTGAGPFSLGSIPGWTNGGNSGQWHPGSYFNYVPDGITVAYSNDPGGTISQGVGTVAANTMYTLQVDLGFRKDGLDSLGAVALIVGSTPIQATGVAPTIGNWSTFTATYSSVAADIGKTLTIRLTATGLQSNFDNVRLNASSIITPSITSSLSPSSATVGGTAFALTVTGSGFLSSSTVLWNGSALSTAFVNSSQLNALVPANLIASPGNVSLTVQNPGGAVSNAVTFTINPPNNLTILTASPLPNGAVGVSYSQGLTATGGNTPYKGWAVAPGSQLPPGISLTQGVLSGTALLSGTPTSGGTFTFTLQVTDASNATATKPFSLTLTGGTLSASGILNAASYVGGKVSPGEIVTIFGSFPGPAALVTLQLDSRGYVSTNLGGAQVLFDGVPAPMIYAVAGQVSCVVPYEVSGESSTLIQLTYQNQVSNSVAMPVATAVPGVFTANGSGSGPGAILNQDGTANSANNPATVGSTVLVYATGEGQTNPGGVDGRPDASPLPQPVTQPVTATVSGVPAKVAYAGGVSGLVAGVMQVNVQIPQGASPGNLVPVVLNIGGVTSQANVTLAIR